MLTALVVAAVLVVLLIAAVAATHEGDLLVDAPADAADVGLPDLMVQPEDIAEVRFGMTLRGYRMSEVDHVLDRLAHELAGRDAQIATLQQAAAARGQLEEPAQHRPPTRTPAPHNPAPEVVAWAPTPAAAEDPVPPVAADETVAAETVAEPQAVASTSWWEPEPEPANPDHATEEPAAVAADPPAGTPGVGAWEDDFPEVLTPEDAPVDLPDAQEPPARVTGSPAPPAEPRAWSTPAFPTGPPVQAPPGGDGSTSP